MESGRDGLNNESGTLGLISVTSSDFFVFFSFTKDRLEWSEKSLKMEKP